MIWEDGGPLINPAPGTNYLSFTSAIVGRRHAGHRTRGGLLYS